MPTSSERKAWRRGLLFFRVWCGVVYVRVRLKILGYNSFEKTPVKINPIKANIEPEHVAQTVKLVANFVPGALCLAQSIAAHRRLAKLGWETTIRIGVKSDLGGEFMAHAWLLHKDKIILGGTESGLEKYRILTDVDPSAS